MKEFLKTTALGGVVFLLPLALALLILAHAWRLAKHVTVPLSHSLHLDRLGSIAGIGASTTLAVLLLVLVAFASGLIARTNTGKRITRWSEDSFLGRMPQYQLMKSMAEGLAQIENASDLRPVLVNIEEGWQIGYQLETLDAEWVAVFVPQAPTPMSGNVMYLPNNRVRPLGGTMGQAMTVVKHMGVGLGELVKGVDLSLAKAGP